MASNIVLPNLTNWTKQHLTTIFQATAQADFNAAFDAFIAQDVSITVNGQSTSRDDYKQQLSSGKGVEQSASVNFLGAVEVPADSTQPVLAGTVGTFFNAIIDEKFLVFGAPESNTVTSALNVVIAQDKSIQPPKLPGRGGFFDPRRVTVLNQVTIDTPNPIVPPGGTLPPTTAPSS